VRRAVALAGGEFHGKLDGQHAEQRSELDNRIQSDEEVS
jgi:hypothetical protein